MPLNRKNRITVKKKKMSTLYKNKKIWTIATDFVLNSIIQDAVAENKNNSAAGCTCQKCGNYNEYAEANQPDGSFVCFSCKNY